MIIEVLKEKYKCGCNRGIAVVEQEGLLEKLNSIIEWDFVIFPSEPDGEVTVTVDVPIPDGGTKPIEGRLNLRKEKRDFLGAENKLLPGNTILIDGNIIAVDNESTLVLLLSKTGVKSLNRIVDEQINAELELKERYTNGKFTINWSPIEQVPENFTLKCNPLFKYHKLFIDKFTPGRESLIGEGDNRIIKVTYKSDRIFFPVELVFDGWSVYYDADNMYYDEDDENFIADIAVDVFSYFFNTYDRLKAETFPTREEQIDRFKKSILDKETLQQQIEKEKG
jgi:hypothetical protein